MLFDAEVLTDKIISSAHIREVALKSAFRASHPFYDALFTAAAIREQVQVLMCDRKLAGKFPDQVRLLE